MKKLLIALALTLAMLVAFAAPAFAGVPLGGGDVVSVVCDGIVVVGDPYVGNTVTASGKVTITSTASTTKGSILTWGKAEADSRAYYGVTDPSGNSVAFDSNSECDCDLGWWKFPATADASQIYPWSYDIYLNQAGDWTITEGGEANAEWAKFLLIWRTGHGEGSTGDIFTSYILSAYQVTIPAFQVDFGNPQDTDLGQTWGQTWVWGVGLDTFLLVMPEGTTITGYDGTELTSIYIEIVNGKVTFSPQWIHFSPPVTLYQLVGGVWVELMTFSEVENGQAVPIP